MSVGARRDFLDHHAAAEAYRGVIPADRWHEPYMSREELHSELAAGVTHLPGLLTTARGSPASWVCSTCAMSTSSAMLMCTFATFVR